MKILIAILVLLVSSTHLNQWEKVKRLAELIPHHDCADYSHRIASAKDRRLKSQISSSEGLSGSFGKVYPGKLNGKEVMIKVTGKDPFNFREVYILKYLEGVQNIPRVFACEYDGQNMYFAQTKLFGDLGRLAIRQLFHDALSFKDRVQRYEALFRTLASIHEKEVVHKDIKPENIMVDNKHFSNLYLIDFGIAKFPTDDFYAGTEGFLSPEDVNSADHISTPATDVWALAVSLVEIEFRDSSLTNYIARNCNQLSFSKGCHEFIEHIVTDYNNWKLRAQVKKAQCSPHAASLFINAILQALRYEPEHRSSALDVAKQLNQVYLDCITNNDERLGYSGYYYEPSKDPKLKTQHLITLDQSYFYPEHSKPTAAGDHGFAFEVKKASDEGESNPHIALGGKHGGERRDGRIVNTRDGATKQEGLLGANNKISIDQPFKRPTVENVSSKLDGIAATAEARKKFETARFPFSPSSHKNFVLPRSDSDRFNERAAEIMESVSNDLPISDTSSPTHRANLILYKKAPEIKNHALEYMIHGDYEFKKVPANRLGVDVGHKNLSGLSTELYYTANESSSQHSSLGSNARTTSFITSSPQGGAVKGQHAALKRRPSLRKGQE